jgi:hypothetical protein
MLRPVYSARTPRAPQPAPASAWPTVVAVADPDAATKTVVAALFGCLIILRFLLTDPLLNLFFPYTEEGGTLLVKIHPATYGIIALLVFSLLRFEIALTASEARIARQFMVLIGVILALSAIQMAVGRSVSMGYLLETYIGGCLTGVMMLTLKPAQRQAIGHMFLIYIAANSVLAILEKAAGQRLMPYPYEELSFRPTAFTSHPLAIGLMHAGAIVFIFATRWSGLVKAGMVMLVVLGTFAAGARTGAIMASIAAVAGLALTPMPAADLAGRIRLKAAGFIVLLIAGPALILAAGAAGFLERFEGGYFDENAKARVDVYQVFDWVSTSDILFGADLTMITNMIFDRLGLLVESSVVILVFQFGLFGAVLFFLTIVWTMVRAGWGREPRNHLAIAAFLATASSNPAMSGKHSLFAMMIILMLAFRRETVDAWGRARTLRWEENP